MQFSTCALQAEGKWEEGLDDGQAAQAQVSPSHCPPILHSAAPWLNILLYCLGLISFSTLPMYVMSAGSQVRS